jgi:uridine kinase
MSSPLTRYKILPPPPTKAKNTVMTSHGRAPWYDPLGEVIPSYVIGIAGGSASGKTSVARAILSALGYIPTVLILSQDAFYRAHNEEEIRLAFESNLDLGEFAGILVRRCLPQITPMR